MIFWWASCTLEKHKLAQARGKMLRMHLALRDTKKLRNSFSSHCQIPTVQWNSVPRPRHNKPHEKFHRSLTQLRRFDLEVCYNTGHENISKSLVAIQVGILQIVVARN